MFGTAQIFQPRDLLVTLPHLCEPATFRTFSDGAPCNFSFLPQTLENNWTRTKYKHTSETLAIRLRQSVYAWCVHTRET